MTKLEKWLIKTRQASNLKIDYGFIAIIGDNNQIQSVARIHGIGGMNGMLIFRHYDKVRAYVDEVKRAGYGFSVLDEPGDEESFDLQSFQEMFRDWGWSGYDDAFQHH